MITFKAQLSNPVFNIVGSAAHIHKAILNLMINAAESVTENGVVTITTRNQSSDNLVHGYDTIEKGDYVVDRGLLLPLMQALNRPETLLTFSRQYKPGDILRINRPGKENVWIKLIKLIADNGSISQYLFTQIESALVSGEEERKTSPDYHDRFSDIWSSV